MKQILRAAAVLSLLFLAACNEQTVYSGLNARDANEMVTVLSPFGINAARTAGADGTYSLQVPPDRLNETVQILSSRGYPRESYRSMVDIFPGNGLVVSPFEHRARFQYALAQELTQTISQIEGVTQARVHVATPEYELRGSTNQKPSASVVVHHLPSVDPADLASKIRVTVANSIQNLSYNDVSISFFPANGSGGILVPTAPEASFLPGMNSLFWAAAIIMGLMGLYLLMNGRRRSRA
jgi:type III secretion protein J